MLILSVSQTDLFKNDSYMIRLCAKKKKKSKMQKKIKKIKKIKRKKF